MTESAAAVAASEPRSTDDRPRFDDLYRRWFRPVVRMCRKRLGAQHDPEAVAQEAFIRAWQSWWRYADDRPFGPWVTVIAHRLCNNELHMTARRGGILARERKSATALPDSFFHAVRRHGIDEAFRSLTPRARRLIVLRDVEGWSYEDIARFDGVSIESVRGSLKRARVAFRSAYTDVVGAPAAVAVARPSLLRRARRLFDTIPWRLPTLEPVAAGVALLVAPIAPAVSLAAADVPPAVSALASTPAVGATTAGAGVAAPLSAPPASAAPAFDVAAAVTEVVMTAADVVDPAHVGRSYTFTASPSYEQDRTVFALGHATSCDETPCERAVLLQSVDGGATWRRLPAKGLGGGNVLLPPDYPRDNRIFARTFAPIAGVVDHLSVSVDGGATFAPLVNGLGGASMAMSPLFSAGDPRILIGATDSQPALVYRDDTRGFEPLVLPLPPGAMPRSFAFVDDGAMLVAAAQPVGRWRVFRCEVGACTPVLDVPLMTWGQLLLSPGPDDVVLAWTPNALYRSADGGRSFVQASLGSGHSPSLREFVWDQRGRAFGLLFGSRGFALSASDDLGVSWTGLPDLAGWFEKLTVLPDGVMLASAVPDRGPTFACSVDGGLTWSPRCMRAA